MQVQALGKIWEKSSSCQLLFVRGNINKYSIKIENLAYFGYHDGLEGNPIGPIYKILLGDSVILSNHGSFSGNDVAYIFNGTEFAIHGLFDKNANLIKAKQTFESGYLYFRLKSTLDMKIEMWGLKFPFGGHSQTTLTGYTFTWTMAKN